jgi:hypothetical protein
MDSMNRIASRIMPEIAPSTCWGHLAIRSKIRPKIPQFSCSQTVFRLTLIQE